MLEAILVDIIARYALRFLDWIFGLVARSAAVEEIRFAIQERAAEEGYWSAVKSMCGAIFSSLNPGPSIVSDYIAEQSLIMVGFFANFSIFAEVMSHSPGTLICALTITLLLVANWYESTLIRWLLDSFRKRYIGTWIIAIPTYFGFCIYQLTVFLRVPHNAWWAMILSSIFMLSCLIPIPIGGWLKLRNTKRDLAKRGLMIDSNFKY